MGDLSEAVLRSDLRRRGDSGPAQCRPVGLDLTGYAFFGGPRTYSPIVSILRAIARPGINLTWEADYDPLLHRFVNSSFTADARVRRYLFRRGHQTPAGSA